MYTLILVVAWVVWYLERRQDHASGSRDVPVTEQCHYCRHPLSAMDVRCLNCRELTRFGRGIRLQMAWPILPIPLRVPDDAEKWEFVFVADYPLEASLFQQQLEARGVASRIEITSKSFLLAGSYTPVNEVQELHVPRSELERCRDFVHELLQSEVAADDAWIAADEQFSNRVSAGVDPL